MTLKIVYIAGEGDNLKKRERKSTKKELLHAECIAEMANTRAEDKKKALKKFAPELKELEDLREELRQLEKNS